MTKPDPYHVESTGMSAMQSRCPALTVSCTGPSEAQIKQDIAREEAAKTAVPGYVAKHKVSALGFVTMGLELEEAQ